MTRLTSTSCARLVGVIHIVQYKSGETKKHLGPPIFSGESYKVGMDKRPPGEWVKVTVEAHGSVTGAVSQGPDSAIRQLANQSWKGDRETTDMYSVVEVTDLAEPAVLRGPPVWIDTSLKIGDDVYPEGKWTKVTVNATGWAAATAPKAEPDQGD